MRFTGNAMQIQNIVIYPNNIIYNYTEIKLIYAIMTTAIIK